VAAAQTIHRVDAGDVLVFVDETWLRFAAENAAPALTADAVHGRQLWGFVADAETVDLYKLLFARVRQRRVSLRVPFRCDSPEARRFMEMEIAPWGEAGVECRNLLLRVEPRSAVSLLEPAQPRSEELVVICSWCKRVQVGDVFREIEEACRELALLAATPAPRLSHGICPECRERVRSGLA
jgi:hypothetical protein